MNNRKKTVKFNVVDLVITVLLIAVLCYTLFNVFGFKEGKRVNNTVEVSLSLSDNFDYVSNIKQNDIIYINGCEKPLGTVSDIVYSEQSQTAHIKVIAEFPHDANVYSIDDTAVLRGESYEIRTLDFIGTAQCTGISVLREAIKKNGDGN